MKSDSIPRIMYEGIRHIVGAGYASVYEEIVEEYGEKLKQDFIEKMKGQLQSHITVDVDEVFLSKGVNVKVTVDVKGLPNDED